MARSQITSKIFKIDKEVIKKREVVHPKAKEINHSKRNKIHMENTLKIKMDGHIPLNTM